MAGNICDVCDKGVTVGVACVSGIPLSVAYCQECLNHHAEPFWAHRANLACALSSSCWDKWADPQFIRQDYIDSITVYHEGQYMPLRQAMNLNPFTQQEFLDWEKQQIERSKAEWDGATNGL